MRGTRSVAVGILVLLCVFSFVACRNAAKTEPERGVKAIFVECPREKFAIGRVDLSRISLIVEYSDGAREVVPLSEEMITEAGRKKLARPGMQSVTVAYGGKAASFDIELEDASAKQVEIKISNGFARKIGGRNIARPTMPEKSEPVAHIVPTGTELVIQAVEKDGFLFERWTRDSIPVPNSQSVMTVIADRSATYRAIFRATPKNVAFETGFDDVEVRSMLTNRLLEEEICADGAPLRPGVDRNGYFFEGWTTDEITADQAMAGYARNRIRFPFDVARDLRLYGVWSPMGLEFADWHFPALPGDGKYVDDSSTPLPGFPNGYFTLAREDAGGAREYAPATGGGPVGGTAYFERGVELTGYSGSSTDLRIPAEHDGKTVARIARSAFETDAGRKLVAIRIPAALREIEDGAFANCARLERIAAPGCERFAEVGGALYSKGETRLIAYPANRLPETDETELNAGFDVSDNAKEIAPYAFYSAAVGCVRLPLRLKKAGERAFASEQIDNVDFTRVMTDPSNFEMAENAFDDAIAAIRMTNKNRGLEIFVPERLRDRIATEGEGTKIGVAEFAEADGETSRTMYRLVHDAKFDIVKGKWEIAEKPRDGMEVLAVSRNVGKYVLQNKFADVCVTSIAKGAFRNCERLEELTLPLNGRLERIGDGAFENTPWLERARREKKCIVANGWAYKYLADDEEYLLPDDVEHIAEGAFAGNANIRRVSVRDNSMLRDIADDAFANCVRFRGFSGVATESERDEGPYLKMRVRRVGDRAFFNTAISAVRIQEETPASPHALESVGEYAFARCPRLVSVEIPSGAKRIAATAFLDSPSLEEFRMRKSGETYMTLDGILYERIEGGLRLACYPPGRIDGEFDPGRARNFGQATGKIEERAGDKAIGKMHFAGIEEEKDVFLGFAPGLNAAALGFENGRATLDGRPISETTSGHFDANAFVPDGEKYYYVNDGPRKIALLWDPDSGMRYYPAETRYYGVECGRLRGLKDKSLTYVALDPSRIAAGIAANAFADCASLKDIYFQGSELEWDSLEKGENWNGGREIAAHFGDEKVGVSDLAPTEALIIDGDALKGVSDKSLRAIVIPAGVKSISDAAFANCARLEIACVQGGNELRDAVVAKAPAGMRVLGKNESICVRDIQPTADDRLSIANPGIDESKIKEGAPIGKTVIHGFVAPADLYMGVADGIDVDRLEFAGGVRATLDGAPLSESERGHFDASGKFKPSGQKYYYVKDGNKIVPLLFDPEKNRHYYPHRPHIVTEIGECALRDPNVAAICIPASVARIAPDAIRAEGLAYAKFESAPIATYAELFGKSSLGPGCVEFESGGADAFFGEDEDLKSEKTRVGASEEFFYAVKADDVARNASPRTAGHDMSVLYSLGADGAVARRASRSAKKIVVPKEIWRSGATGFERIDGDLRIAPFAFGGAMAETVELNGVSGIMSRAFSEAKGLKGLRIASGFAQSVAEDAFGDRLGNGLRVYDSANIGSYKGTDWENCGMGFFEYRAPGSDEKKYASPCLIQDRDGRPFAAIRHTSRVPALGGDGKYVDDATTPLENFPVGYYSKGEDGEYLPASGAPAVGAKYYVSGAPKTLLLVYGALTPAETSALDREEPGYAVKAWIGETDSSGAKIAPGDAPRTYALGEEIDFNVVLRCVYSPKTYEISVKAPAEYEPVGSFENVSKGRLEAKPDDWSLGGKEASSKYYVKTDEGRYSLAQKFVPKIEYFVSGRPSDWTAAPNAGADAPSDKYYETVGGARVLSAKFAPGTEYWVVSNGVGDGTGMATRAERVAYKSSYDLTPAGVPAESCALLSLGSRESGLMPAKGGEWTVIPDPGETFVLKIGHKIEFDLNGADGVAPQARYAFDGHPFSLGVPTGRDGAALPRFKGWARDRDGAEMLTDAAGESVVDWPAGVPARAFAAFEADGGGA